MPTFEDVTKHARFSYSLPLAMVMTENDVSGPSELFMHSCANAEQILLRLFTIF